MSHVVFAFQHFHLRCAHVECHDMFVLHVFMLRSGKVFFFINFLLQAAIQLGLIPLNLLKC